MANYRMPEEVRRFNQITRLMGFLKPDPNDPSAPPSIANGVRPIGIPPVTRRTAYRPLATAATARHAASLASHGQFGCGVRAGVEVPPRVMQVILEQHPLACVDSEDCYNAFQELSHRREEPSRAGHSGQRTG